MSINKMGKKFLTFLYFMKISRKAIISLTSSWQIVNTELNIL